MKTLLQSRALSWSPSLAVSDKNTSDKDMSFLIKHGGMFGIYDPT